MFRNEEYTASILDPISKIKVLGNVANKNFQIQYFGNIAFFLHFLRFFGVECKTVFCFYISPLDFTDALAEQGEILSELHHGDDEGTSNGHAGRPEEGVKESAGPVQSSQKDILLFSFPVMKAWKLLMPFEMLSNALDYSHVARLFAFWYIKTLWIDFQRLLRVGQPIHFSGGVQDDKDLQTGIL